MEKDVDGNPRYQLTKDKATAAVVAVVYKSKDKLASFE